MKLLFLFVPMLWLAGCLTIFGQTEPVPLSTPNDIPAASAPQAKPAASPAMACPECGSTTCPMDDKHIEATKPAETEEVTFTRLEQEWGDALVQHDVAAIERIESDDYTYTGPDGAVSHKPDEIAAAKAKFARIDSFEHREIKVRVYGETAVVTGATTLKGAAGDVDMSGDFRWTDVFVKRDGRWQVVVSQATAISKAEAGD